METKTDWLRRLQRGARLLFWSQLAAYMLPNVYGFLLPLVGGPLSNLKWGAVVHALASLPAILGVFALSSRGPQGDLKQPFGEPLRIGCRILATSEVLRSIIVAVSSLIGGNQYEFELEYLFEHVGVAASVAVLLHLRQLAGSFGAARLARLFLSLACVYVALVLANILMPTSEPRLGIALMVWLATWLFLYAAVWVWGLVLIARFRRKVGLVIAGHCGNCDYDLTGNESGTCSECGRQI